MTPEKLRKIREQLQLMNPSQQIMPEALVSCALRLGREPFGQDAEPVYVRTSDPKFGPISIPTNGHPVRRKVAQRLLDQLNDDADAWEQYLLTKEVTPDAGGAGNE